MADFKKGVLLTYLIEATSQVPLHQLLNFETHILAGMHEVLAPQKGFIYHRKGLAEVQLL